MKMDAVYFDLKHKLEELGYYNYNLPLEAVPLVECILADLLQTTRSLQHYMELSKEVLSQQESLAKIAEPYKCDNIKLLNDNNKLRKEVMKVNEMMLKTSLENKQKIELLSKEIAAKELIISKLKHEIRDYSLRGLCASTQSSRNKSKKKEEEGDMSVKKCDCGVSASVHDSTAMLKEEINSLEIKNRNLNDNILFLNNQIENRECEIARLNNILLEKSCAMNKSVKSHKDFGCSKTKDFENKYLQLVHSHAELKKEFEKGLEKQHEAMSRALDLAEKNKMLKAELLKVEELALKVEQDCNKRLSDMSNQNMILENKIKDFMKKTDHTNNDDFTEVRNLNEYIDATKKENISLRKEIFNLLEFNKTLQDKVIALAQVNKQFKDEIDSDLKQHNDTITKELQSIIQHEVNIYQKYLQNIEGKISETLDLLNKHCENCKSAEKIHHKPYEDDFIKELHNKLCENEQKVLKLKKENEVLQTMTKNSLSDDTVKELNCENSELLKENMYLSKELSYYKQLCSTKSLKNQNDNNEPSQHINLNIKKLQHEISLLKKDKSEYQYQHKKANDTIDKLKRDLAFKMKQIEQLQEENSSYKLSNKSEKYSISHLQEECDLLRNQLNKVQIDYLKEKTMSSQIKNLQAETERSNIETQNEIVNLQKKLSLARKNVESLEQKCTQYQAQIMSLTSEKADLINNLQKLDKVRDKLVLDLDNKAESISLLENKIQSQLLELSKKETELCKLKRCLSANKLSEHKLKDYEAQINYLNNEIAKASQNYDNALMENRKFQNDLANVNGKLRITNIELDKSKKEVDSLKQQLQHYVAEVRRIEELLSEKEAERSDMLEQFATLSVEANILENTNHSLENESASKTQQLQFYINKIHSLETQILEKDKVLNKQSSEIAELKCKIISLENKIEIVVDEKKIMEQDLCSIKKMYHESQNLTEDFNSTVNELKIYKNKIRRLTGEKDSLEIDKNILKEKLETTEKLLGNARKEIVGLKLVLQDATSETKKQRDYFSQSEDLELDQDMTDRKDTEAPFTEGDSPLIGEYSSLRCNSPKAFSKYTHSSTI